MKKNVMRAGPQLGVDAFSISNYGSAMFAQVQPQHSPLMLLTPTASVAAVRSCRSASSPSRHSPCRLLRRYSLADAFILSP
ncbi:MAG: hypothetical protein J6W51_09810 [Fibrobacter sp.]|nr:hypothetical protein [Fibrobacter sp.]